MNKKTTIYKENIEYFSILPLKELAMIVALMSLVFWVIPDLQWLSILVVSFVGSLFLIPFLPTLKQTKEDLEFEAPASFGVASYAGLGFFSLAFAFCLAGLAPATLPALALALCMPWGASKIVEKMIKE